MEEKVYGVLFNKVNLLDENHLEVILQNMDKNSANYLLIQAVTHAFHSGVFSLGESEVISKCIRVLNQTEEKEKVSEN
jgi:hypothetical protein